MGSLVCVSPQVFCTPGRKGKTEPGMGNKVWFGVSAKTMEELKERRPSPRDLGKALYNEAAPSMAIFDEKMVHACANALFDGR